MIDSDTVHVTGDTVNATQIEIFAPEAVKVISWNGRVLNTAPTVYGSLKANLTGPISVKLPTLGPWKGQDSLPEVFSNYSDSSLAWLVANHTTTKNSASGTLPYLYSDDYGFHTGSFIYRGLFNGSAAGLNMTVYGGQSAGYSVYLNGALVGASLSSSSSSASLTITFPNTTLVESSQNLLTVVVDTSGHDEGSSATTIRGIQNINLVNSTSDGFSLWKVAGTAGGSTGTYLDPVRGPYNEAGWYAERLGWHLPGFDDSTWPMSSPSDGFQNATVRFFRTKAALSIPDGQDLSIVFTFGNVGPNSDFRALLYINGYQYGRYNPRVNTATVFPVPPGILNYAGDNEIAVLVWAQSTSGAAVTLDWNITEIRESSFNPRIEAAYLQPRWNNSRLNYA